MFFQIWAVTATLIAVVLTILHFRNPYPLIQIPDRGHRLFAVPRDMHNNIVHMFKMLGYNSFGTFRAGVRQTLLSDGITVIASGDNLQSAAVSLAVTDPERSALWVLEFLRRNGLSVSLWKPDEESLVRRLYVVKTPFGWDLALRLRGSKMPSPQWEQ